MESLTFNKTHAQLTGHQKLAILKADIHALLDSLNVFGMSGIGANPVLVHQGDQVSFRQQRRCRRPTFHHLQKGHEPLADAEK